MVIDDVSRSGTINSVIRLASLIQRAIDKRRTNYEDMCEISKHLSYMIKSNIDEILKYMELLLENSRSKHIKRLKNDLHALFNELLTCKISYENLVNNNRVERDKLMKLIDIDNEIINSLKNIVNIIQNAYKESELSPSYEREIRKIAAEVERYTIKRKVLDG
ncbi:MAG: hypothetical protein QW416_01155 [Candidatus Nitrosocaldaceae archaeon]